MEALKDRLTALAERAEKLGVPAIGWQVSERLELGVKARNVFHQVRQHYPIGDEIGSELIFSGTFEF